MITFIINIWIIASLIVGVVIFFENDQKFGTRNFKVSIIFAIAFFTAPIIFPILWIVDYIVNKK